MVIKNIKEATEWFEVLQTGERSQTAIMTLQPGQASGKEMEKHKTCEQVLLVLEGEVVGYFPDHRKTLSRGDVVLIPAGFPHKFVNESSLPVSTFNTYSPPEY